MGKICISEPSGNITGQLKARTAPQSSKSSSPQGTFSLPEGKVRSSWGSEEGERGENTAQAPCSQPGESQQEIIYSQHSGWTTVQVRGSPALGPAPAAG